MDDQHINSDLIRGNIDTIILGVLMNEDNYGYSIIKEIYRKSGDVFELKEPTLYSSLRRLEAQYWVESYWGEQTQGGRRKYYRITTLGREIYDNNFKEWQVAKQIIDRLIVSGDEEREL